MVAECSTGPRAPLFPSPPLPSEEAPPEVTPERHEVLSTRAAENGSVGDSPAAESAENLTPAGNGVDFAAMVRQSFGDEDVPAAAAEVVSNRRALGYGGEASVPGPGPPRQLHPQHSLDAALTTTPRPPLRQREAPQAAASTLDSGSSPSRRRVSKDQLDFSTMVQQSFESTEQLPGRQPLAPVTLINSKDVDTDSKYCSQPQQRRVFKDQLDFAAMVQSSFASVGQLTDQEPAIPVTPTLNGSDSENRFVDQRPVAPVTPAISEGGAGDLVSPPQQRRASKDRLDFAAMVHCSFDSVEDLGSSEPQITPVAPFNGDKDANDCVPSPCSQHRRVSKDQLDFASMVQKSFESVEDLGSSQRQPDAPVTPVTPVACEKGERIEEEDSEEDQRRRQRERQRPLISPTLAARHRRREGSSGGGSLSSFLPLENLESAGEKSSNQRLGAPFTPVAPTACDDADQDDEDEDSEEERQRTRERQRPLISPTLTARKRRNGRSASFSLADEHPGGDNTAAAADSRERKHDAAPSSPPLLFHAVHGADEGKEMAAAMALLALSGGGSGRIRSGPPPSPLDLPNAPPPLLPSAPPLPMSCLPPAARAEAKMEARTPPLHGHKRGQSAPLQIAQPPLGGLDAASEDVLLLGPRTRRPPQEARGVSSSRPSREFEPARQRSHPKATSGATSNLMKSPHGCGRRFVHRRTGSVPLDAILESPSGTETKNKDIRGGSGYKDDLHSSSPCILASVDEEKKLDVPHVQNAGHGRNSSWTAFPLPSPNSYPPGPHDGRHISTCAILRERIVGTRPAWPANDTRPSVRRCHRRVRSSPAVAASPPRRARASRSRNLSNLPADGGGERAANVSPLASAFDADDLEAFLRGENVAAVDPRGGENDGGPHPLTSRRSVPLPLERHRHHRVWTDVPSAAAAPLWRTGPAAAAAGLAPPPQQDNALPPSLHFPPLGELVSEEVKPPASFADDGAIDYVKFAGGGLTGPGGEVSRKANNDAAMAKKSAFHRRIRSLPVVPENANRLLGDDRVDFAALLLGRGGGGGR